jgi:hypothetical protein
VTCSARRRNAFETVESGSDIMIGVGKNLAAGHESFVRVALEMEF